MLLENTSQKNSFIISVPTPEEEFDYLMSVLTILPELKRNDYTVTLPHHPLFDGSTVPLKKHRSRLCKVFKSEVYKDGDYTAGLCALGKLRGKLGKALPYLNTLHKAWGFSLYPKYYLTLTLFGPGGSYDIKKGEVMLLTRKDGMFKEQNPLYTIIHEIVHLGIEENIVTPYHLNDDEKERLGDLICKIEFSPLIPDYPLQFTKEMKLDAYVNSKTIHILPKVLHDYRQHK